MSRRKVFFASTLESALAAARKELGPEALLVEAGPAESGHPSGAYRVVCEGADETGAPRAGRPDAGKDAPPAASAEGLWKRLDRLERTLDLVAGVLACLDSEPGAAAVRAELAAQDFPPEWIVTLMQAASRRVADRMMKDAAGREAALRRAVAEELEARIAFEPLPVEDRPALLALVGPPGAGKTSLLVKLAMQEGLRRRRAAAILSTDSHRVAAAEQLRTYAAILGLPFCLAETPAALRQNVAEHSGRDLLLLDTPGFGRQEREWALEWAALLNTIPGRRTLLVLPACWRTRDLLAALPWWSAFEPAALAFTRLDETDSIGGWTAAALESGLPVACFGTGQGIPEHLEPASPERLRTALGVEAPQQAMAGKAVGGAR